MAKDNTYNGWTNRETWLVNIHFNPTTKSDVDYAKEYMEEQYEQLSLLMRDFVDLYAINWQELKDAMDDD